MNKVNHPIEQEELMAYLDGELALDRAATAAAHLEKCRDCQNLAGDLQSISRKMMAWQVESGDDLRMSQAIAAALEEREQTNEKPAARGRLSGRQVLGIPRLPRWLWAGGITVTVIAVLVFVSSSSVSRMSLRMSEPERARIAAYTPAPAPAPPPRPSQSHIPNKATAGDALGVQSTNGTVAYNYDGQPNQAPTQEAKPHSTTPAGPMIVRTASLTLITRDFDKARFAMEDTLRRHGGYIGQLTVSAPGESGRSLTATLRIPAGQLDAAMAELKKFGRVASESQSGEEVTQQYVDLEARLANAKNSEQRLSEILRDRTGKLSDVLEVEQAIEEVRGNIEQMEAERKNLAKQVSFATLNTTLTEEYESKLQAVPVSTFTRVRNAAVDGYSTLSESVVNVILFLFSYGPVLLLWGAILFFPLRAVWRRLRKRIPAGS